MTAKLLTIETAKEYALKTCGNEIRITDIFESDVDGLPIIYVEFISQTGRAEALGVWEERSIDTGKHYLYGEW